MRKRLSSCFYSTLALALALSSLSGCARALPRGPGSPPDPLNDGWEVSSLSAEGVDARLIAALEERISKREYAAPDSLLIVRNGKLIYERYWNGFGRDTLHDLRSATKSVTSMLVGIALARGVLPGLDAPVVSFFPQHAPLENQDDRKERLTLRHLLEMRTGLACDDWQRSSPGNEERMYRSRDWAKFVLDLPMLNEPGMTASYCTGGVVLLGAALQHAAREPIPDISRRWLFEPLGIERFEWQPADGGITDTGGHLRLRPRDFAKLGQLYLDGGRWRGQQVVPEAWVQASTKDRHRLGDSAYGFLWWSNTLTVQGTPLKTFFARGNGGQYLFVFPSLQLVVAFTGSHYNAPQMNNPIEMCGRYLLPAVLGLEQPVQHGTDPD